MDFKDYYSTLGVAKTATEKEIKQAYRKLARKHHPDVNPNDKSAEGRFKEINEAYEVLSDQSKRQRYDTFGHSAQGIPGFEGAGFGGIFNRHRALRVIAGGDRFRRADEAAQRARAFLRWCEIPI